MDVTSIPLFIEIKNENDNFVFSDSSLSQQIEFILQDPAASPEKSIKEEIESDEDSKIDEVKEFIKFNKKVEEPPPPPPSSAPSSSPMPVTITIKEEVTEKLEYGCVECSEKFESKEIYDIHMSGHANNMKCAICNMVLKSLKNYEKHCLRCKPYECQICGRVVRFRPNFIKHMRVHTGQQHSERHKYKCEVCHKEFMSFEYFKVHKKIHNENVNLTCEICGKVFSALASLRGHSKLHSGVKLHKCHICGKGFGQRYNLKIHARTHTGEIPFGCKFCNKRFHTQSSLQAHLLTHQQQQQNQPQTNHSNEANSIQNRGEIHESPSSSLPKNVKAQIRIQPQQNQHQQQSQQQQKIQQKPPMTADASIQIKEESFDSDEVEENVQTSQPVAIIKFNKNAKIINHVNHDEDSDMESSANVIKNDVQNVIRPQAAMVSTIIYSSSGNNIAVGSGAIARAISINGNGHIITTNNSNHNNNNNNNNISNKTSSVITAIQQCSSSSVESSMDSLSPSSSGIISHSGHHQQQTRQQHQQLHQNQQNCINIIPTATTTIIKNEPNFYSADNSVELVIKKEAFLESNQRSPPTPKFHSNFDDSNDLTTSLSYSNLFEPNSIPDSIPDDIYPEEDDFHLDQNSLGFQTSTAPTTVSVAVGPNTSITTPTIVVATTAAEAAINTDGNFIKKEWVYSNYTVTEKFEDEDEDFEAANFIYD
ncbi:protein suppressor of hairy wing-like [Condylostylus longicornis]|uniref:protein suppressor of hairy wing-like n=1 Tax=Condylostylus longicornis TaxID=2530218 RepID=UPI00244E28D3|nr:protein suppressor of hairy wing-like [Condylostylus longicornis]